MAESLRARVGRVIAGGLHALLGRIEDQAPDAMMEQLIREADGVIDEVRTELGRVSANRHLAQQQHASLNDQHEKLVDHVGQAMASGRDDLARAAVARQLDIEAQLPVLEMTLAEQAGKERELQGYVAALLAKKREMEAALSEFLRSRASARVDGSAEPVAGAGMDSVVSAFDRLYMRQTGLSGTDRAIGLQQAAQLKELDELTRENKIAERLAQLRAGKA